MTLTIFFFVALLLIPLQIFAEEPLGSLNVKLEYTNGDRLDAFETSLIIYQDNKENLFEKLDPIQINPLSLSLPLGHNYFLEPVVNGIHLDPSLVDLDESTKSIKISVPLSGGVKFQVFYNDNYTPIEGATVSIKSSDGKEWKQSVTDEDGHTARFWIQSTINSQDYFIVDTSLGSEITYSYNSLEVQPGIPQDIKITTDFPKLVQRIDISIFKDLQNKLVKNDGKFIVELFDAENNLVSKSKVDRSGKALVSLVNIGEYDLKITNVTNTPGELWYSEKIVVKNEIESFKIFPNPHKLPSSDSGILSDEKINPLSKNCECVAFRFDDIQDYWLNDVQIQVMDVFLEKNIPLTIGIIGNNFGTDAKIVEYIKENSDELEIANHGFNHEDFTSLTKDQQNDLMKQTNTILLDITGKTPKVFIPPFNSFNEDTIAAIKETEMTHLSSSILKGDLPPFPLENVAVYRFPEITTTGFYDLGTDLFVGTKADSILDEVVESITKYGFAVVTMHPQEFSLVEGDSYKNKINLEQMIELDKLIKKVKQSEYEIVTISQINLVSEDDSIVIPPWIRNNAGWWAEGAIDDNSFVQGIQYLIKERIMQIPETQQGTGSGSDEIPSWIKNNAAWWASDQISDNEFVNAIQYLIENGIIRV